LYRPFLCCPKLLESAVVIVEKEPTIDALATDEIKDQKIENACVNNENAKINNQIQIATTSRVLDHTVGLQCATLGFVDSPILLDDVGILYRLLVGVGHLVGFPLPVLEFLLGDTLPPFPPLLLENILFVQ
jgi:hypothetical protein